ncbi:MAG: hypothetical protein KJ887_00120 [Candidatus Omnitrophica bacterium]|nr:hypothetical protein [Candidatus Omnitrophota bacterium]MBU1047753.1 hypothetical protein [Candidatus Omnitrophota bacterium]MBU1631045.1 hypothetical protein [Candidatus Omnitrophota bacterium]MBU1889845.1 hypothetical protein [Candidatus Omnitrophota bacterium]
MLEKGEKIHAVERRYFPNDVRRHFCGEVLDSSEHLIRAIGYVWVFNTGTNQFVKKPEKRERILCLGDRLTVNVIPKGTDINKVTYMYNSKDGHLVTDGQDFHLSMTEFGIVS